MADSPEHSVRLDITPESRAQIAVALAVVATTLNLLALLIFPTIGRLTMFSPYAATIRVGALGIAAVASAAAIVIALLSARAQKPGLLVGLALGLAGSAAAHALIQLAFSAGGGK